MRSSYPTALYVRGRPNHANFQTGLIRGCSPHSSAVTPSFVPSDCTLILRPVLRLFAVSHQPVADLLPLFTLKPFSSSLFCVPHMSDASGANSTSRPLVE